MIQLKVFDFVTGEQIQTIQVFNFEFYVGLLIGCICGLCFWVAVREMI